MCADIDKTHAILSSPVFAYAIYIPPIFQREVISLRLLFVRLIRLRRTGKIKLGVKSL